MNIFEKYHETHCGCGLGFAIAGAKHVQSECKAFMPLLTVWAAKTDDPDDAVFLFMTNGRGNDIMAITADGQMHFAPGYTPSQQAEAFRQAMNMASQRAVFPLAPRPNPSGEGRRTMFP